MRRRKQLKCPFDSEEALEAKGKNAKAKRPYDQSTQSLTSLSTLEDGNDAAYAIEKSETKDEEHHSMADRDGNSMSHACSHLTLLRNILVSRHENLNPSNDSGTRIGVVQMMAASGK